MSEKNRAKESDTDKKTRRTVERTAESRPATEAAGLATLPGSALGAAGDGSIDGQAARLGHPGLQTAQRQALATVISGVGGNQHLQRIVGLINDTTSMSRYVARNIGSVRESDATIMHRQAEPGNEKAIEGRLIGKMKGAHKGVSVRSHGIEEWRAVLKDATDDDSRIVFCAFLAKAVGHDRFRLGGSPFYQAAQERWLREWRPIEDSEAIHLMIALLSTTDIDLNWWGHHDDLQEYLISRFIDKYYTKTIDWIEQQRLQKGVGALEEYYIHPMRIAEFSAEAGEGFAKYAERVGFSPLPHRVTRVTGGRGERFKSPAMALQANALAHAQFIVAEAFGLALSGKPTADEEAGYGMKIGNHARVLSGVVRHKKAVEEFNEAVLELVLGVVFSGIGAAVADNLDDLAMKLGQPASEAGKKVAKEATSKSVSVAVATAGSAEIVKDLVKAQTKDLWKRLAGLTADELKTEMLLAFDDTINHWVTRCQMAKQRGKNINMANVNRMANGLRGKFRFY